MTGTLPTTAAAPPRPRTWLHHPVVVILLTSLAPISWGTTYVVTTELLPPDHPIFAAVMRALPPGLLALAITRVLPRGLWWWRVAVLGILTIGIFFPLLFVAAERLPGGVAATLAATQPIAVAVLAVAILRETPSWWRIGWGLVGLLGVGLVVLGPSAVLDLTGLIAGLVAMASMAVGLVLVKKWGRPPGIGPMTLAGWLLAVGGVVLLPLALLLEGVPPTIDAGGVAGYLWLGVIGGLVAYTLWYWGLDHLPVTATALLALLSPLVAALMGLGILGETFSVAQLSGFALALLALVAGQLPGLSLARRGVG